MARGRRELRAVAVAVLAVVAFAPRARAQTIPAGPGGELTSLPGIAFDVPIYFDLTARADMLGAFSARINWDPAVLRFDAALTASFGGLTVNTDSLAQGIVRLAGANPAGAGGIVTVAQTRFTPVVADTTTLGFTVYQAFAAGTFTDLLPSVAASGRPYCPALGRYGDIDANGAANGFDALLALTHSVGLPIVPFSAALGDVDANGSTNARDALIILSNAVGLDVSAFRVLRMAAGACGTAGATALAIRPGAVGTLVPGQDVHFEAVATSAGTPIAIPNAAWRSSDPAVLAVLPTGIASALAPGTATVTAVRDGRDSAQLVVQVVAHRTMHFVDAGAGNANDRLGTPELPFSRVGDAVGFAQAGDSVRVRPGRYTETVTLDKDVLVWGDTLADGTRPEIAEGDSGMPVLLNLAGTGSRTVRNLALSDAMVGVDLAGPTSVDLDGIRVRRVYYGVTASAPAGLVTLRRSRLLGMLPDGYGTAVDFGSLRVDTLRVLDTEIGDWGYGIRTDDFGLLEIRRSILRDPSGDLICCGSDNGPSTTDFALVVDSSFLRSNVYGDIVDLYGFTSVDVRHSRLEARTGDVFDLYDGAWLRLVGDTIVVGDYGNWMYLYGLDSLVVDSVQASLADAYAYAYNVRTVRLTNSTFTNVDDEVLDVYYGSSGSGDSVIIDNVAMSGNPAHDQWGYGIYVQDAHVVARGLTAVNLYRGLYVYGDSSALVEQSVFRHVENPVQVYGYGNSGTVTVRNSLFEDFGDEAVEVWDATSVVDSNTFRDGWRAVDAGGWGATITRNRITRVNYGIDYYAYDSAQTATVANNVLTGLVGNGIEVSGSFGGTWPVLWADIRSNAIDCPRGASGSEAIRSYRMNAVIADNTVSGCIGAILVDNDMDSVRTDSVLRNTVVLPAASDFGVAVLGNQRGRVGANSITGDTTGSVSTGGIVVGTDYYYCITYGTCQAIQRVDSNLVQMVAGPGVFLTGGDSVDVRHNTVLDVRGPAGVLPGITVGFSYSRGALVYGNQVERATGAGVQVNVGLAGVVTVDSNRIRQNGRGVDLSDGHITVTRNRITGSTGTGVNAYAAAAPGTRVIANNNISGNRFGLDDYGVPIVATNNWWGDALGPRCATGCNPASLGDSVSGATTFAPFLTSEDPATPPAVPPMLARPLVPPAPARDAAGTARAVRGPARARPRAARQLPLRPPATAPSALLAKAPPALQRLIEHRVATERTRAETRAARAAAITAAEREREVRQAERERQRDERRARQAPVAVPRAVPAPPGGGRP